MRATYEADGDGSSVTACSHCSNAADFPTSSCLWTPLHDVRLSAWPRVLLCLRHVRHHQNGAVPVGRCALRKRAAPEGGARGQRERAARVDGASGRREREAREGGAK